MKLDVQTLAGKASGSVDLDDSIFANEPRKDILHRMVRYQLARRQAGTHEVQERGDVSKRNKRIGRQKGGGTARHGNGSVSQFRGGAKAHGPRVRSHAHGLPKKLRALALRHALSAKAGAKELIIIDDAVLKSAKTAELRKQLAALGITNGLIVSGNAIEENFAKAAKNIPNLDVLPSQGANVYDILKRHKLVLTKQAVADLEARLK
ncbi:50S ribosomal protein L4 [Litorimonas haliclonae]|uniref:50S ribosomal protein L4 n=1 Tax=Litorimonas haliclonae TaxID=2081977 RepID=UPI0039F14D21